MNYKIHLLGTLSAGFIFLQFPGVAQAQVATFTPLGDAYGGPFDTAPIAISKDGTLVLGSAESSTGGNRLRVIWENGVVTTFGPLWNANQTRDIGRHADNGVTVVGYTRKMVGISYVETAAFWDQVDGETEIPGLPLGSGDSQATAISSDATSIVGTGANSHAFHWNLASGLQSLATVAPATVSDSVGAGVSPDGNYVTGDIIDSGNGDALLWDVQNGTVQSLHGANSTGQFPTIAQGLDVNDKRIGIGYVFQAPSPDLFVGVWGGNLLGSLPEGIGKAISSNGVIVGFNNTLFGPTNATISTNAGGNFLDLKVLLETVYGLDLTGWALSAAVDISEDGKSIVGSGINPDGNPEAWLLQFSYSPGSPAGYGAWISSFGLPVSQTRLLESPTGDDVANLLKFAFNLDPTKSTPPLLTPGTGTSGMPNVTGLPGGGLRIEYLRRRDQLCLHFEAQFSDNLETWSESGTEISVDVIDSVWERVVVEDSGGARQFARVEVSF